MSCRKQYCYSCKQRNYVCEGICECGAFHEDRAKTKKVTEGLVDRFVSLSEAYWQKGGDFCSQSQKEI